MGLDKSRTTYIHHYNVIQSIFTAHKNFCPLCIHLPSPPKLLVATDLFVVSVICLFQIGTYNLFFFFFFFSLKREVGNLYVYKTTHGPPSHGPDRLWVANSPTKYCSFPSSIEPCPTGLAQQPRGGSGDTCWVLVHRKATSFVPLITMNPDSCRVCCKQNSHISSGPLL